MIVPPFDSENNLRTAFVTGLERLLEDEGLGVYILVLANALFDSGVFALMRGSLERGFEGHAARCRSVLLDGRDVDVAEDDLMVFLKLVALGFSGIGVTEFRRAGPWEVQFNLLRAFRPKRMSDGLAIGSQRRFDANTFHFNKPFLRKETFWRGRLCGRSVDLLYNKFPFVDLHGLLVPERERELPQFLTRRYHEYIWYLSEQLGPSLPGVGFGYNSFGAFASVNHLHFQMFVRASPLPLTGPDWRHNGGHLEYPASCLVFQDPDDAWCYLDHLHREEKPYNLVYSPGRLHCLPRARQGNFRHAPWTGGFAWYEMAGGAVAYNRKGYLELSAGAIAAEMRRVGVTD